MAKMQTATSQMMCLFKVKKEWAIMFYTLTGVSSHIMLYQWALARTANMYVASVYLINHSAITWLEKRSLKNNAMEETEESFKIGNSELP